MTHPSESEILHVNYALRNACAVLFQNASSAGIDAPPLPPKRNDDIFAEGEALKSYHANLSAMLVGKRVSTAPASSPAATGSDLHAAYTNLRASCVTLAEAVRNRGGVVPKPPTETGSLIVDHVAMCNYSQDLNVQFARLAGIKTSEVTPPKSAKLSPAEVKHLNWTERVQYAGGKLSLENARVLIAPRIEAAEKAAEEKAAKDPKRPAQRTNYTHRVLAEHGCKTIAELRHFRQSNPSLD